MIVELIGSSSSFSKRRTVFSSTWGTCWSLESVVGVSGLSEEGAMAGGIVGFGEMLSTSDSVL